MKSIKARKILNILSLEHPEAKIALNYSNGYEMLFAVILSAQCTDKRVNLVTPMLFARYKSLKDYANADILELESIIKSTGFYKQKALRIRESARILVEKHKGKIPKNMEELTNLPGVGRKTANVVLSNLHNIHEGIVVDTHVKRLSNRIGFTISNNPEIVERDLMGLFTEKDYIKVSDLLIFHGRKVCNAQNPKCNNCVIYDLCEFERKVFFYAKNMK